MFACVCGEKKNKERNILVLVEGYREGTFLATVMAECSLELFECSVSSEFRDGIGPRLGNGISPCFFTSLRGGVRQAIPKSLLFFDKKEGGGKSGTPLYVMCGTSTSLL